MTGPCAVDGLGLSGQATWRLDEASLVVAPSAGAPLTIPLAEIAGVGGDEHRLALAVSRQLLVLSRLGADGPGLATELGKRWLPLRAGGLRLTGGGTPKAFYGAVLGGPAPQPFQALLHDDVLLLAPAGSDVQPVFLALADSVGYDEAEYAIELRMFDGRRLRLGRMAAQTAPFVAALRAARTTLADRAAATHAAHLPTLLMAARIALAGRWLPGRFVALDDLGRHAPGFVAAMASSWLAACPRRAQAEHLLGWADAGRVFFGYGSLDSVPPPAEDQGDRTAAEDDADTLLCLLAGRGERWALEVLSVGDFATYVFTGGPELPLLASQLLCAPQFSREALYLPVEKLTGPRAALAIAARELPFLVELRRRLAGRFVHGDLEAWRRQVG